MLPLSIIIVSYNVKYFLEQCLLSVNKAIAFAARKFDASPVAEVIVVDNNSTDDTTSLLDSRFNIRLIKNQENVGFARANNQALGEASGEFVLFLNPDTILPEDALVVCVEFMRRQPSTGACGVKMVDGEGNFLKESKRGFPTPWVAFTRLFGLARMLPRSPMFNKYYLGHLDENQDQTVEALAGAFMLVRKTAIDTLGGFDEQFFMYAEDIDLSYRLHRAGWENCYLANCVIIHFKGESTKKDRKYKEQFYGAMRKYAYKHHRGGAWLLNAGIWIAKQLSSPKTSLKIRERVTMYFLGDRSTANALRHRINHEITMEEKSASDIILCEGPEFSFKELIQRLQEIDKRCWFYASGAAAVISSPSAAAQGDIIPVK